VTALQEAKPVEDAPLSSEIMLNGLSDPGPTRLNREEHELIVQRRSSGQQRSTEVLWA
jgi:hypothetical protein